VRADELSQDMIQQWSAQAAAAANSSATFVYVTLNEKLQYRYDRSWLTDEVGIPNSSEYPGIGSRTVP